MNHDSIFRSQQASHIASDTVSPLSILLCLFQKASKCPVVADAPFSRPVSSPHRSSLSLLYLFSKFTSFTCITRRSRVDRSWYVDHFKHNFDSDLSKPFKKMNQNEICSQVNRICCRFFKLCWTTRCWSVMTSSTTVGQEMPKWQTKPHL